MGVSGQLPWYRVVAGVYAGVFASLLTIFLAVLAMAIIEQWSGGEYWRDTVAIMPVFLFFLGLPLAGLTATFIGLPIAVFLARKGLTGYRYALAGGVLAGTGFALIRMALNGFNSVSSGAYTFSNWLLDVDWELEGVTLAFLVAMGAIAGVVARWVAFFRRDVKLPG